MPPEENSNNGLIDWGAAFLGGLLKHVAECLHAYTNDIDGNRKYWCDGFPEVEDGIITIKLKIPQEDLYYWWQANSRLATDNFMTPKQWRDHIEEVNT